MIRIDGRSQTQLRPVRLWSDLFGGLPAATTRLTVDLTVEALRTEACQDGKGTPTCSF